MGQRRKMRYLSLVLLLLSFTVVSCNRHRRHDRHHNDSGNSSGSNHDSDRRGDNDLLGSRKVNLGGDVDRINALDQGGTFFERPRSKSINLRYRCGML